MKKDPRVEKYLANLPPDHPRPVTRRQFLAAGLTGGLGWVVAPSVLDAAFSHSALAGSPAPIAPPALLIIDCAGGASLSGNWLVGKQGGPEDRLRSYDTLGLGSSSRGNELKIDSQFGAPMVDAVSQIHAGLITNTSAGARAGFRMGTLCSQSQDDNSGNQLSMLCAASRIGASGRFLAMGLGTSGRLSGGNSRSIAEDPGVKPLAVRGVDDVKDALRFGPHIRDLGEGQRRGILKTMLKLSQSQLSHLFSLDGAKQFSTLLEASVVKADSFIGGVPGLDPRENDDARAAFKLDSNAPNGATLNAAISFNVIQGNSGPGVITIPGCDYHDGTQSTGDGIDQQIGTAIGQAVEFAHRRQTPLFISVITDGGIYSDAGTRNWRGDSGIRGLAVVGYYHPKSPAKMRRVQLGAYTDGQAVERMAYVAQMPARVGWATFANYLSLCGRLGEFEKFVVPSDFEVNQIDAHLFFE